MKSQQPNKQQDQAKKAAPSIADSAFRQNSPGQRQGDSNRNQSYVPEDQDYNADDNRMVVEGAGQRQDRQDKSFQSSQAGSQQKKQNLRQDDQDAEDDADDKTDLTERRQDSTTAKPSRH